MRSILFVLACMMLVSLIVLPAAAVTPLAPGALDKMKANVAKITDVAEKGRWMANIDLWTAALAKGTPAAMMKSSLDQMKANVAKVTAGLPEKERWQANIDLWQTFVGEAGKATPADDAKMKTSLDMVKAKVATIADASEKERWQANVELWESMLAKP